MTKWILALLLISGAASAYVIHPMPTTITEIVNKHGFKVKAVWLSKGDATVICTQYGCSPVSNQQAARMRGEFCL